MDKSAKTITSYGYIPKEQRRQLFGLDTPEQLQWKGWEPGNEFTKQLVIKNHDTKAIKFKYKQPTDKAFSMDFPEWIKLRPGMSCSLKIVFRPPKLQPYHGNVEVFTDQASFFIPVQAFIPATQIEVSPYIDFGFVPIKEQQTLPLHVKNVGEVQVDIAWQLDQPFSIRPMSLTLAPGQSHIFTVYFEPTEASSYGVTAACQLDSGAVSYSQIRGIGKFPYLSLEQPTVDFGEVVVGSKVQRVIKFGNHSVVPANFTIVSNEDEGHSDGVFDIQPTSGTLGPDEYSLLTLTYTPKQNGMFSSEHLTVSTAGGNHLNLNLRGGAAAPAVTLSSQCINFGNTMAGAPVSRVLYIQNHSSIPVLYDCQVDALDIFSVSKPRGILPPATISHVTITFSATLPANYWRRLVILVKDAEPLSLDLLGTTFNERSRPPPLQPRHISTYMARVLRGGAPVEEAHLLSKPTSPAVGSLYMQPDEMGAAVTAAMGNGSFTNGFAPLGTERSSGGYADATAAAGTLVGPHGWELAFDGPDPGQAVTVDTRVLDFGTCSRLSTSQYRNVTVSNRTDAKLSCFIHVPPWTSGSREEPRPMFQVFPETADIRPHSQISFKVAFRPTADSLWISQRLVLCCQVKSQRSFRMVADHQIMPPWEIDILAHGNTFLHSSPEHSPKVELSTSMVNFPPCKPRELSHQTLMIANYGDTPTLFSIPSAPLAPHFTVNPDMGVIPPKSHVLVGLRFSPAGRLTPAEAKTVVRFNNTQGTVFDLRLSGRAHAPRITFDVASTLYFRPTCLGASSQRVLTVHNPSRVPVAFLWQLPKGMEGVVAVSPLSGTLRGKESAQVTWTFAPNDVRQYEGRAKCLLVDPDVLAVGSSIGAASFVYDVPDIKTLLQQQGGRTNKRKGTAKGLPDVPADLAATAAAALEPAVEGGVADADAGGNDARGGEAASNETRAIQTAGINAAPDDDEDVSFATLTLVGEGTGCAVELDPPALDFGDLPVGLPVRRDITLMNVSDGVLLYSIEMAASPGDEPVPDAVSPCEFQEVSAALSHDAPSPGSEAWVDEPEGTLPARASKTLRVTFFPKYRKTYRLELKCRTSTMAPLSATAVGGPGIRPPSSRAQNLPRLLANSEAASDGALNGGTAGNEELQAPLAPPVAAVAAVSARTIFPSVAVTDVFSDGRAKHVLWHQLGVSRLNAALADLVTPVEVELDAMEYRGSLTTEVACSSLEPFLMDVGNWAIGGRECRICLEFTNANTLACHFELHSFDDPAGVELENWIEPGRPRNEEEKLRDFIRENRLFEVVPRGGNLEPGARATLEFIYRPTFPGLHELPLFLHCRNGRRMHLRLRGATTVEPHPQAPLLPPAYKRFVLHPAPLGDRRPPLQTYPLRNGGPSPLRWIIDTQALAELRDQYWGHEVIVLVGPTQGEVQPGLSELLCFRFSPLEARTYQVQLPIHFEDGSQEIIEVVGQGYLPRPPPIPPSPKAPAASKAAPERTAVLPSSRAGSGIVAGPVLSRNSNRSFADGATGAGSYRPGQQKRLPPAVKDKAEEEANQEAAAAVAYSAALQALLPAELEGTGRDWDVWQNLSKEPQAAMPLRLAFVDHDCLSLGACLVKGVARQLVLLTNKSRYPLAFAWDTSPMGGEPPFAPGAAAPLSLGPGLSSFALENTYGKAIQARVSVSPASGKLEPGERLACRVLLEAGVEPQLFEGEIFCHVSVDQDALFNGDGQRDPGATTTIRAGPEGGNTVTGGGGSYLNATLLEEEEEVLEMNPPKNNFVKGSKLRSRLPVHVSMTTATRARAEPLAAQYDATLNFLSKKMAEANLAPQVPEPQVLTLSLSGSILCPEQISAGWYLAPHLYDAARKLLEGYGWLPPPLGTFFEGFRRGALVPDELQAIEAAAGHAVPVAPLKLAGLGGAFREPTDTVAYALPGGGRVGSNLRPAGERRGSSYETGFSSARTHGAAGEAARTSGRSPSPDVLPMPALPPLPLAMSLADKGLGRGTRVERPSALPPSSARRDGGSISSSVVDAALGPIVEEALRVAADVIFSLLGEVSQNPDVAVAFAAKHPEPALPFSKIRPSTLRTKDAAEQEGGGLSARRSAPNGTPTPAGTGSTSAPIPGVFSAPNARNAAGGGLVPQIQLSNGGARGGGLSIFDNVPPPSERNRGNVHFKREGGDSNYNSYSHRDSEKTALPPPAVSSATPPLIAADAAPNQVDVNSWAPPAVDLTQLLWSPLAQLPRPDHPQLPKPSLGDPAYTGPVPAHPLPWQTPVLPTPAMVAAAAASLVQQRQKVRQEKSLRVSGVNGNGVGNQRLSTYSGTGGVVIGDGLPNLSSAKSGLFSNELPRAKGGNLPTNSASAFRSSAVGDNGPRKSLGSAVGSFTNITPGTARSSGIDSAAERFGGAFDGTGANAAAVQRLNEMAVEADQFGEEEKEKLARTFVDPAFKLFAEYVLESALYGLMQQSAAGDWLDEEAGDEEKEEL